MDFTKLRSDSHLLIDFLISANYCKVHIQRTIHALNYLLNNENNNWKSYEDAYRDYCKTYNTTSTHMLTKRKIHMNMIYNFDQYGLFPGEKEKKFLCTKQTFADKLSPPLQETLCKYHVFNCNCPITSDTAHDRYLIASSLLYKLQEKGCKSLDSLNETAVLDVFINGGNPLSRPYKSVMRQLLLFGNLDECDIIRFGSFIPKNRNARKNKQFLSKEDCIAVHDVLHNETSLSLRDRAIGALLFYTGLRAVDISKLLIESVDFENDWISLIQSKTSSPLGLPIRASFGNLLYDYIEQERPKVDNPYVFLVHKAPFGRISEGTISTSIVNRIFDAASIRLADGDARGSHIFRRNVVVTMLEKNIERAVISSVVGHDSPESIEPYLGAAFVHLKECALSLDKYPIRREVFNIW